MRSDRGVPASRAGLAEMAQKLDARVMGLLGRRGPSGALVREIVEDLACRGNKREILAALGRLEGRGLVRSGEVLSKADGAPRILVSAAERG